MSDSSHTIVPSATPEGGNGESPFDLLAEEDRNHLSTYGGRLNLLRDRVRSVAGRYQNAVYIVGRPGSSKTFTVLEELEKHHISYVYKNAKMTAPGLWNLLHDDPQKVFVFDDIPSLAAEKPAQQILLAALGGEPGRPRTVTYTTAEVEGRRAFQFVGGIIAISNVALRRDPIADAIGSRCVLLEHEPSDEELAAFMRYQALLGQPDLTPEECKEVVEFIILESKACEYRLDLRLMCKAWGDYRQWRDRNSRCDWRDLVRSGLKKIVSGSNVAITRRELKDHEMELAKKLLQRYPGHSGVDARDQEWKQVTGKSTDTLLRRIRQLKGQPF